MTNEELLKQMKEGFWDGVKKYQKCEYTFYAIQNTKIVEKCNNLTNDFY